MSLFRRLSITLLGRIERAVEGLENHEAVIEAALREMRERLARARARQQQLKRECARVAERRQAAEADAARWRERALAHAGDEERALACLHRSHECRRRAMRLAEQESACGKSLAALGRDIDGAEVRMEELRHKWLQLSARDATGEALAAAPCVADLQDVDAAFERWEFRVRQSEALLDESQRFDPLEQEILEREEEAALRAELETLIREADHERAR